MDVVELINKYGFPIVMAVGLGYIIKYVWTWSTQEVKPVISEANKIIESDRVMEQMKVEKEANERFEEAAHLDDEKKKKN